MPKTAIYMQEMLKEYFEHKDKEKENKKKIIDKEILEFERAWLNAGLQVYDKDNKGLLLKLNNQNESL
jgi:hypothetical protein